MKYDSLSALIKQAVTEGTPKVPDLVETTATGVAGALALSPVNDGGMAPTEMVVAPEIIKEFIDKKSFFEHAFVDFFLSLFSSDAHSLQTVWNEVEVRVSGMNDDLKMRYLFGVVHTNLVKLQNEVKDDDRIIWRALSDFPREFDARYKREDCVLNALSFLYIDMKRCPEDSPLRRCLCDEVFVPFFQHVASLYASALRETGGHSRK